MDAVEFLKELKRRSKSRLDYYGEEFIIAYIDPESLVAPVAHGQWENGNPICPVCGKDKFKHLDADLWSDWKPDYCPNCGAKMDERH